VQAGALLELQALRLEGMCWNWGFDIRALSAPVGVELSITGTYVFVVGPNKHDYFHPS